MPKAILPKVNTSAPNLPSRQEQDAMIDQILQEQGGDAREAIRTLLVINGALVDQLAMSGWRPPTSHNIAGQRL